MFETEVGHGNNVLGKIKVIVRIRTACIVFETMTLFNGINKVFSHCFIRIRAAGAWTHMIMHFFTTVNGQYHTQFMFVEVIDFFLS